MSDENGREIIKNDARVSVLLPLVFREPFDYRVPEHMHLAAGDYVRVPFGRKSVWGVVWGEARGEVDEKKLKTIEQLAAHLPPMKNEMRAFIDWVAWYTLAPLGMVLKMALSAPDALEPPALETRYALAGEAERASLKLTPARVRVNAYLSDNIARTPKDIAVHAKVSDAVVRDYIKSGALVVASQTAVTKKEATSLPANRPALSLDQEAAADHLKGKIDAGFSVTVLDGVTGSGKTEVYFDCVEKCIAEHKQVLVLLPEISLSVQWLARFAKRFGFEPDHWHSGVTPARKRNTWRSVAEGSARVVVGARSALFLPFKHLACIIVDEEHDPSYKQEDGVIYQARDMAVVRAAREKIPAVLVSATPSLETEFNITQKRYTRVHLPDRHGEAELPQVQLIDMRKEKMPSGNWLSEPLRAALISTVAAGKQAMLFMNRRGYAPLMLCRSCGHRFQCPHCTSWLVLHKGRGTLLCHHCGHMASVPKQCPECKHEDSLIPYGPGVERVAEEVQALLPQARVVLMTSDSSESGDHIHAMSEGKIDVLVGTQMIAKGHHFAGLALVGVVDGDMGLGGGDLRASERTYQLLHQLSGRAGREKVKGEVFVQTYLPEHPVMQALQIGERDRFMELEAQMREDGEMPPFGKLAAIIVEGSSEQEVATLARELTRAPHGAIATHEPLILGPAPAPLTRLSGKYRYRILIKATRNFQLQQWLSAWLAGRKIPASLKVKIDIEPYSFI